MDLIAKQGKGAFSIHLREAIAAALVAGFCGGTVGAETLDLGGLGSVTLGGNSVANADLHVGDTAVKADVLNHSNGTVASACIGGCTATNGGVNVNVGTSGGGLQVGVGVDPDLPGRPVIPGDPGVPGDPQNPIVPVSQPGNPGRLPPTARMPCAGDGNTVVYNGYTVLDKHGVFIGWVNDTKLDPTLKIQTIRIQTAEKRCVGLAGAGFVVTGKAVRANIDSTAIN